MRKALRVLLKALAGVVLTVLALALAGIGYGWASRGLFVTTADVDYALPEEHPVQLPRDLVAHPDFKTEWWYWTGHLADEGGREFGFELVFFHTRTLGVWRDHLPVWWFFRTHATAGQFAVLDKQTGQHVYAERLAENSRSNVGASTKELHVWTYDWSARQEGDGPHGPRVHLVADNERYALDLQVQPVKPAVLHGDGGLLRKAPNGVNSNYLSYTRLAATGTLTIDGRPRKVSGLAWHDHEYASGEPAPATAGWDWLAIQLDAATELMLYQVRGADGRGLEGSKGTLVSADGTTQALVLGRDFTLETGTEGTWTSPATGAVYPLGWRVTLPGRGWTLDVTPVAREQELAGPAVNVNYWEGACTVRAQTPDGEVKGVAYVELCGYDKRVDAF
jgi:predicted secreted hydrolase